MTIYRHYVNGRWTLSPTKRPNLNPANLQDVIGEWVVGDEELVQQAVAGAVAAAPVWANVSPEVRADALEQVGFELMVRRDELGRLIAREEGKTAAEGIGEATRAARIFRYFAGEAVRLNGEHFESTRPGVDVDVIRRAVGVCGLITPYNFPSAIPAWKLAPALAFGNPVIFKPAEATPASAHHIAEIISRTGLPTGVFNMIYGDGPTVGAAIVNHPDVAAVSFTGSVETGRMVANTCVARGARVQCEMGGKNPLIILDDADLDRAVDVAVNGAFFSTGQRCTASSRLIVTAGIHDQFVDALKTKLSKLVVGDPRDPRTRIGPVIDEHQLNKNLEYIEIGLAEGATLACGGTQLSLEKDGYFMAPTLFVNTHNHMRINREEIFGPIAAVIPVADYDEALAVANDTPYGLSAGICTQSLQKASHFKRHSAAGLVMVNLPTAGVDYNVPFGGTKSSSYGPREQGAYAREFYTTVKTCYTGY